MIRGVGKQFIFEDEYDKIDFVKAIQKFKKEHDIRIHAYCLMENHVHLLLEDQKDEKHLFMKELECTAAGHFNQKYDRVGVLFQNRYKSEPVDDEVYFRTVLRYILQNPKKAGICKVQDYRWSSFREYYGKASTADVDFVKQLFSSEEEFIKFVIDENDDQCLDIGTIRIDDRTAKQLIQDELKLETGLEVQRFDRKTRDEYLRRMKNLGLSLRQIERLTGVSKSIVQKA